MNLHQQDKYQLNTSSTRYNYSFITSSNTAPTVRLSAGGARTVRHFKPCDKPRSFMYSCCLVNHRFISKTCILEVRSTTGEKGGKIQFYEEIKNEVYGILPL